MRLLRKRDIGKKEEEERREGGWKERRNALLELTACIARVGINDNAPFQSCEYVFMFAKEQNPEPQY